MKRFQSIHWMVWLLSALGVSAVGIATGCSSSKGGVDENYGRAFAEANTRQIQNPGAGETLVEIEEIGPGTAEEALANYHRNQDTAVQEQRLQRLRQGGIVDVSRGN
jgi:hypothetical protein